MLKSMTGYGSAKLTETDVEYSVEIKSVNNRYLDVSVHLPRGYLFCENSVKSTVSSSISRGKVDLFISISSLSQDDTRVILNEALASEYISALNRVSEKFEIRNETSAFQIARLPDVLTVEKKEVDREKAKETLIYAVESALQDFDDMRMREGEKLEADIVSRLDDIEDAVNYVEQRSPESVLEYCERLTRKMQEVLVSSQIDEVRILTEAAIYADRISVDEETVRIHSHISQMREMLSGNSPIGRKLDFIVQELNRETNTIGSKCNDAEITKVVLNMKSQIEKIREQVQNIE